MQRNSIISFILIVLMQQSFAQVAINTTGAPPNPSAILDINAANKGFLPPRVALTSVTSWALAGGTPVNGMIVYNTASASSGIYSITPGLYFWQGNQWYAFSQAVGATFTASASYDCQITSTLSPNTAGLMNGQAYTGTLTVPYTAANGGSFPADVITTNGLILARSSGNLSTGTGNIYYSISGVWTGPSGTYANFSLNLPDNFACGLVLPIPPAVFAANSLACVGFSNLGTYQVGLPATSANTFEINIEVNSAGTYSATTNTANGISFAATGTVLPGIRHILVTATGTPISTGTFNYTVNLGGQTCTFPITFVPPMNISCGMTQTGPQGMLTAGVNYTGAVVTWPYTNGNGLTTYPGEFVGPINGLALVRNAGTIASGNGSVTYTLSGTFTGTTGTTVLFPVSLLGNNCSVVFGDGIRIALASGGCNSCAAYDATLQNSWIKITSQEYDQLYPRLTGSSMAGTPSFPYISGVNPNQSSNSTLATNATYNTKIPASSYLVGFAVMNTNWGSRVNPCVKFSTAFSSGYTTYGGNLPNETLSGNYNFMSYFVIKRPSTITPNLSSFLAYYDGGGPDPCFNTDYGVSVFGSGNTATLTNSTTYWFKIQAVTTTAQQW